MNTWKDSYQAPKYSQWLQANVKELDMNVKRMLELIEPDADSFAKRAEMYYKKRPELMNLVEEFYRLHRTLGERFDKLTGDVRELPKSVKSQYGISSLSPRGARSFGRKKDQQAGFEKLLKRFSGKDFEPVTSTNDDEDGDIDDNIENTSLDVDAENNGLGGLSVPPTESTKSENGNFVADTNSLGELTTPPRGSTMFENDSFVVSAQEKKKISFAVVLDDENGSNNNVVTDSTTLQRQVLELKEENRKLSQRYWESTTEINRLTESLEQLRGKFSDAQQEKILVLENLERGLLRELSNGNVVERKEANWDEEEKENNQGNVRFEKELTRVDNSMEITRLRETNAKLEKLASSRAFRLKEIEEGIVEGLKEENRSAKIEIGRYRAQLQELQKDVEALKTQENCLNQEVFAKSKRVQDMEVEMGKLKEENQRITDELSSFTTNFSMLLHEKKNQVKIPDLEISGNDDIAKIIQEPTLEAEAAIVSLLEIENKSLKAKMVDLRKEQERRVNSLNKKLKDMHRQVESLGEECKKQKVALVERAEEKREAIRQLCFRMDFLMERNQVLELALLSTRKKLQQELLVSSTT